MKRLFVAVLMAFIVFTGCKKNNNNTDIVVNTPESDPNAAYCIYNGLGFYTENTDGTLKWANSLLIGDMVTYLDEVKKFSPHGQEYDYCKVKRGDTEGWALSYYIIQNSRLGVIINPDSSKAVLYTEPNMTRATAQFLSFAQVVAIHKDASNETGFVKISCWDGNRRQAEKFVFTDAVSTDSADINAAILYRLALDVKSNNLDQYKIHLENALRLRSPVFNTAIQMEYDNTFMETMPLDAEMPTIDIPDGELTHQTVANLRLRKSDDANAEIIMTIPENTPIRVIATGKQDTINGISGNWVKIQLNDGREGWGFDGYIRPYGIGEP